MSSISNVLITQVMLSVYNFVLVGTSTLLPTHVINHHFNLSSAQGAFPHLFCFWKYY